MEMSSPCCFPGGRRWWLVQVASPQRWFSTTNSEIHVWWGLTPRMLHRTCHDATTALIELYIVCQPKHNIYYITGFIWQRTGMRGYPGIAWKIVKWLYNTRKFLRWLIKQTLKRISKSFSLKDVLHEEHGNPHVSWFTSNLFVWQIYFFHIMDRTFEPHPRHRINKAKPGAPFTNID